MIISRPPSRVCSILIAFVNLHSASAVPFAELYHFANEHDPERPCWFADGVIPIAGTNLTALACRDGRDDADGYCFVDVWVPCSNWGKTPYAPPYVLPEFIGSGVPVAELPVPMLLHEAFDARTFPRLESNLQAFQGGIDRMRTEGEKLPNFFRIL